MPRLAHYILLTAGVSTYLIAAWILYKSEKEGWCLLGLLMLLFYAAHLFDALILLIGEDAWFVTTEGVVHGTVGAFLLYGAMIWVSIIVIAGKKAKEGKE